MPDIDEFRKIVVKKRHLNTTPEIHMVEGAPTCYWDNYSGNGTTVLVRDMDRPSAHFVQVKLLKWVKVSKH